MSRCPGRHLHPPVSPGVPVVVVSLCPGRHLYSLCPGRHLYPGVPVCIYIRFLVLFFSFIFFLFFSFLVYLDF